jgi:AAA family ATP:ADP antiporter
MAYIPLDQEAKIKGQGAVEVIGGRAGKSGGAFIQSTLLAVIGGSVSLASLTFILGPLVIVICSIWAFSVFGLGRRFSAIVAAKEAEKAAEEKGHAAEPAAAKATVQIGN